MRNRFSPEIHELRKILTFLEDNLEKSIANADVLWFDALRAITTPDLKITRADVKNILMGMITGSDGIPWDFYDVVSQLIKQIPLIIKDRILGDITLPTGYEHEYLRVTANGEWQIIWIANPNDNETSYREIALTWYIPPEQSKAPMVPVAIIDHVASCILLLRNGLVLPAASTLSIILEATLWEALQAQGIKRSREQIIYTPVTWRLRKMSNKLLVTIDGADKNLKDMNIMTADPTGIPCELRIVQGNNSTSEVALQMTIGKDLVSFLASEQPERSESRTERGLSAAIQRGRSEAVACLNTIPRVFDETLVSLRNNLVHLPSRGVLEQPIPIPGRGQMHTIDDIRNKESFVYQLLYLVIEIVRSVYQ